MNDIETGFIEKLDDIKDEISKNRIVTTTEKIKTFVNFISDSAKIYDGIYSLDSPSFIFINSLKTATVLRSISLTGDARFYETCKVLITLGGLELFLTRKFGTLKNLKELKLEMKNGVNFDPNSILEIFIWNNKFDDKKFSAEIIIEIDGTD